MIAYTREKILLLLKLDFIRFCIVGGTGFVINLLILVVLRHGFGVPIFVAQVLGAETALFSNFMLHHHWTYKSHKVQKSLGQLLVQFHVTSWPAIVGSALMVSFGVHFLHLSNLVALAISSTIALVWNYTWSKFVIWRDVNPKNIEEEIL